MSLLRISAIIPAYNNARLLPRAIESILRQAYPLHEIIVVDDGSKDETPAVVAKYGDRVRYVRQENAGASAARNRGVMEASGDWVAFLDADDWWLSDRLTRQAEVIARHPHLVWVAGRFLDHWSEATTTNNPITEKYRRVLAEGEYFPDFYEGALAGVDFSTCAQLIQRKVLIEAGLFDVTLKVGEDCDLWYRIADRYPAIGYVDSPLFVYDRTIPQSLTKLGFANSEHYGRFLARHVRGSPPGKGEAFAPKERFFQKEVGVLLWAVILAGDSEATRQIVRKYDKWLPGKFRLPAKLLSRLPGPVLRGAVAAYTATVGRVRMWNVRKKLSVDLKSE